jgi:hypothetical protein
LKSTVIMIPPVSGTWILPNFPHRGHPDLTA